NKKREAMCV
ncbi:hypothetical protein L7F22_044767, partial [Adiantum nelumboides]|nr:hypothetical protein [Adiantum nelumboides]